jgi:hypothetical protein
LGTHGRHVVALVRLDNHVDLLLLHHDESSHLVDRLQGAEGKGEEHRRKGGNVPSEVGHGDNADESTAFGAAGGGVERSQAHGAGCGARIVNPRGQLLQGRSVCLLLEELAALGILSPPP